MRRLLRRLLGRSTNTPTQLAAWAVGTILTFSAAGCGGAHKNGAVRNTRVTPGKPAALSGSVIIFHAASLTRPFAELERVFEQEHPGVDIVRESSSSRVAIRKITELGRPADILASADDYLLRDLMFPESADWCAVFARNRVVIGFTDRSRAGSEISPDNWYDILLRKDVQFGYANPDMAPVGYRTLICWKLANLYYADKLHGHDLYRELRAACPPGNIRPHVNELLPALESLRLDYIFLYRSVALQHNLKWIKLPDAVDLGNENRAAEYARVAVEIGGKRNPGPVRIEGRPITYGITIPKDAPNRRAAAAFLKLLFSKRGMKIMNENFQEPLTLPLPCYGVDAVPAELRNLMKPASAPGNAETATERAAP